MNIWDIAILLAVLAVAALAVGRLVRNKRTGRGTCGCGCENCPSRCGKRG